MVYKIIIYFRSTYRKMNLSRVIRDFYGSSEKYLFLKLDPEEQEIIVLVKSYTKPRMIARTEYKAKTIEIKCEGCNQWNDKNLGESEYPGYMSLPGDSSVKCQRCGERTYFCNEYDSLLDYKKEGNLRCVNYRPTNKLVVIKEPFEYPRVAYNKSYRKWNRNYKKEA